MHSPAIDIVIPTLNCSSTLRRCLVAITNQQYDGVLSVIVVDGGSTDPTIRVAQEFGCRLHVNPGQYGVGLDGARHYGEIKGSSELIWYLDSDNILEGRNAATDLSTPFVQDPSVNVSVPFIAVDPQGSDFNSWISQMELANLERIAAIGEPRDGWIRVEDLHYGLPNASIVRRSAVESVGGFDSDVAMLHRLRCAELATAALVRRSKFRNQQVVSAREFAAKWRRRLGRYGQMDANALSKYFAHTERDWTLKPRTHGGIPGSSSDVLFHYPFLGLLRFFRTGKPVWLWGAAFPFVFSTAIAPNGVNAFRAFRNFGKS